MRFGNHEPGTPDGPFPKSFGFTSCSLLVKPNPKVEWTNLLSRTSSTAF